MRRIAVQEQDFDPGAELARLELPGGGAIGSFIGVVRGADSGRPIAAMTLEHYPGMTEKMLDRLAEEAQARWALAGCTIIHRVGRLRPGERIVFVGAASRHRAAALEAVAFLIDWLKTKAPFWKLEEFADGERAWVAARETDDQAAARWEPGSR